MIQMETTQVMRLMETSFSEMWIILDKLQSKRKRCKVWLNVTVKSDQSRSLMAVKCSSISSVFRERKRGSPALTTPTCQHNNGQHKYLHDFHKLQPKFISIATCNLFISNHDTTLANINSKRSRECRELIPQSQLPWSLLEEQIEERIWQSTKVW